MIEFNRISSHKNQLYEPEYSSLHHTDEGWLKRQWFVCFIKLVFMRIRIMLKYSYHVEWTKFNVDNKLIGKGKICEDLHWILSWVCHRKLLCNIS